MQSGVAKLILFGINATTIKIVTYHEHGIFSWLSVIRFQYLWSPIIKNQMTNVVTKVHFLLYYHFYIIFFLSMIYKSMYLLQCIEVKLYKFFYFFILLGNQNIFHFYFLIFFCIPFLTLPCPTGQLHPLQRHVNSIEKFQVSN